MIFPPDGNLGYEALNSCLSFCRYCRVGNFVGSYRDSDILYTNGTFEGVSVKVTTSDTLEHRVNIFLCLSSHDDVFFFSTNM